MHFLTFVIIDNNTNIENQVASVLDPFWADLEVEPYRRYLDPKDVEMMARHYGTHHSSALARNMKDWTGCPGGLDRRGLYYETTANPDGRWDWYEIGGCWDKYIPHSRQNVIRARTLARAPYLEACLPCSLVTPDGEWLENEDADLRHPPTPDEKKRERDWMNQVRETLAAQPDNYVACVDAHT